ncbi:MAG: glycosyltransferase [Solirubrobacterales bacterium]|nr:glycosyltransferase [Solirubrobacterales bacterium]
MTLVSDGVGSLRAPVAVRVLDLDGPLGDLDLSYQYLRQDYRSLLAVVRLAENPIGVATFPVDPDGFVTRAQLAGGLRRQLGVELTAAYARRDRHQEPDPFSLIGEARNGAHMVRSPPVSVIVPTCCNPGPLERCLRSIFECDYDDFEVIVVENRPGSSQTARMLVERFPGERALRYVEEPRPSASLARNAGLTKAEGEIVAFTDDDVVVDPLWLRASVEALTSERGIACVTGLILPLELESESQLLLEQFAGFGKGFRRRTYRLPDSWEENPLLPYTAGTLGSGASIVMLTEVGRELGGFDPALGPATPAKGGEDIDLLARVLQSGHGLSYEPRAIVWHEHPGGRPRLRRQVYSYGVGLGAMLAKQVIAGPDRRGFLRAVPAGLRYLRDPGSRKNAGKPENYPRGLTWLERLGMLIGPALYLLSALMVQARRLTAPRPPSPRPLRIVRAMVVGGEPISVSWFTEVEPRRSRFAWRRNVERSRTGPPDGLALAAALLCVVAPILVLLGAPTAVRFPFVLAFVSLVPGIAGLTAVGGAVEPGLIIGTSVGFAGLVAQSMLWFGVWWPRPVLYGVAAACLVPLTRRLARTGVRIRTGGAMRVRSEVARLPRPAFTSATAKHAVLIGVALLFWATSLLGADLSRIDGLGLLSALPPTYFLAFAVLLAGFAVAVTSREANPRLLGAYVLALIVVIHATTASLYDEPRYAWTYPHLGVINLIAATGHANRQVDIYNNWPSFFALSAWFTKTSGLAAIAYAGWAQLWFNLFNVFAVRFALRGLTRDERVLWTAALLFVLGNWVGQDYLAPQAFGFALSLVVLGLCLRCGREGVRPRFWPSRGPAALTSWVPRAIFPRPEQGEERAAPPISSRAALIAGGACYVAIVTSHQLSPVMLTVSVLLLALITRKVPLWVPAVMAAIELWWVLLAWSFLQAHFNLVDPGGGGAAAPGRNLSQALPGAGLSFYAPAAVMMLMAALAAVGFVRRFAQGKRDLTAICLAAAPVGVVVVQSYGGEGPYRAYLFALPWLSFLAVFAFTARRWRRGKVRMSLLRLLVVTPAVGVCLLAAFFGQELANHLTSDDVRASLWYEQHAPAGSMRIDLAPNEPDRLTARYPLVDLSDPSTLVTQAQFTGHQLGASDVPRLIRLIQQQRARPAYVVLSRLQEDYARLNGLLPAGSLTSFVGALEQSPAFGLVYSLPTAWIFRYGATPSQPSTPQPLGGRR